MKDLLAAYTAALNRYDLDAVAEMFAENAIYISPGLNATLHGRTGIMDAFRAYFAEHADQVNVDEDVHVLDANTLQARWRLQSSKSKRSGTQIIRFDGRGKIKRIEVRDD